MSWQEGDRKTNEGAISIALTGNDCDIAQGPDNDDGE